MAAAKGLTGNRLLDALPTEEQDTIRPNLRELSIRPYDSLIEPDEAITEVFFPIRGVVSLITPLSHGGTIETASIGNEGMIGFRLYLGGTTLGNTRVVAQVPGEMFALNADVFTERLEASGKFRDLMKTYSLWVFEQISQNVACAGAHDISQRAARWLLETHDRVEGDSFRLTHEFLAEMLAVTRPSVSVVARQLQEAGLIDYRKAKISILDRAGLEDAACECYAVVKSEYQRLVGLDQ